MPSPLYRSSPGEGEGSLPCRENAVTSVSHYCIGFSSWKSLASKLGTALPISPRQERYFFIYLQVYGDCRSSQRSFCSCCILPRGVGLTFPHALRYNSIKHRQKNKYLHLSACRKSGKRPFFEKANSVNQRSPEFVRN